MFPEALHPSADLLLRAALDMRADAAVAAHLSGCLECLKTVDELRACAGAIAHDDAAGAFALAQYAAGIAKETAAATELLEPELRNSLVFVWASIAEAPKHRTLGTLRALLRIVEWYEKQPLFAAELMNAAIAIADGLIASDPHPAVIHLLSRAWAERANALRDLGRHDEAFAALEESDRVSAQLADPRHERAITAFFRVPLLNSTRRIDESLRLLPSIMATFSEFGDQRRLRRTRVLCANVASKRGDETYAIRLLHDVEQEAAAAGDYQLTALTRSNAALSLLRSGDAVHAKLLVVDAIDRFREHYGEDDLRSLWLQARTELATGNVARALQDLRKTAQRFEQRGMLIEAAEVDQHITAALRELGRTREVARIGGDVARTIRRRETARALALSQRHKIERILELYLQQCYADRTCARVSELAEHLGIGRQHLTRVCRETLGIAPHEALRNRQLRYARDLIEETTLPISEIVVVAGFGVESTLFRQFQAHFGVTPRELRRERQQEK